MALGIPSVTKYQYPYTPLGAGLFRVRPVRFRATDPVSGGFVRSADYTSVLEVPVTAQNEPANGTIRNDLELSAGATLGSYSIQVRAGEENFMNGSFEVEEYKKPEYEVRVTPNKARILQGETAQAVIDSRYGWREDCL